MTSTTAADRNINIEVTLALDLTAADVWPDGPPDTWTPRDVLKVILAEKTFRQFNDHWNADVFGAEVTVYADGKFERGDLA